MALRNVIGGFIPLEIPVGETGMLAYWSVPQDPSFSFTNGRSAVVALINHLDPPRVWIPAYIGWSIPHFTPEEKLRFYPVGEMLSPDCEYLAEAVGERDLVLGVNYFGLPPRADFLEFVRSRPDVVFLEDAAQSMDTGIAPWGTWRLYCPRKLFGVPDGGILIPPSPWSPPPAMTVARPDVEAMAATLMRFEDAEEVAREQWHDVNERQTDQMGISKYRMFRLSRSVLGMVDPNEVASRRRRNFRALDARMDEFSFLRELLDDRVPAPDFVPFGFPVRLPAEILPAVRAHLFDHGIYAGRHWVSLRSPRERFSAEYRLSEQLITLPCDQRYEIDEMDRLSGTVLSFLKRTRV